MHPSFEYLLICDIDNTLTGDDEALSSLITLLDEQRGRIGFGVATGRSIESTREILRTLGLGAVDVFITAVGSEIYYDGGARFDEEWRHHIDVCWDREAVLSALSGLDGVRLQPHPLAQRAHKVSYTLDDGTCLESVTRALDETGVEYRAILSHRRYLDVLPRRASKALAIEHVARKWGMAPETIIVAGDSENDRSMLEGPFLAIVVANHERSLEDLSRCYWAKEPYAAGIIEGLRWWGILASSI